MEQTPKPLQVGQDPLSMARNATLHVPTKTQSPQHHHRPTSANPLQVSQSHAHLKTTNLSQFDAVNISKSSSNVMDEFNQVERQQNKITEQKRQQLPNEILLLAQQRGNSAQPSKGHTMTKKPQPVFHNPGKSSTPSKVPVKAQNGVHYISTGKPSSTPQKMKKLEIGEEHECRFLVREVSKSTALIGEMCLSNFKLQFVPNGFDKEHLVRFVVPYGYIMKISDSSNDMKNTANISIWTKDERTFKFRFESNHTQFFEALKILKSHCQVSDHYNLYCHKALTVIKHINTKYASKNAQGFPLIDIDKLQLIEHADVAKTVLNDFQRTGITRNNHRFRPLKNNNPNHKIPATVFVAPVSDQIVQSICKYRKSGVLPTCTYVHQSKETGLGCSIWRSAEPTAQLLREGCDEDQAYINMLAQNHMKKAEAILTDKLHIFTARAEPKVGQSQSGTLSYGFENPSLYKQIQRHSYNMNYKQITKSFSDTWQLAHELSGKEKNQECLMSKVIKTEWIQQIEGILTSAQTVARILEKIGANVLIYCPQGNIGTPLLASLAQLFCDPYYRTLEGFKTLVHKEWVYYRHNFIKKCLVLGERRQHIFQVEQQAAQSSSKGWFDYFGSKKEKEDTSLQSQQATNDRKLEPVFMLFLDAVYQLVKMNPLAFEFEPYYLTALANKVFTNKYFEFVQGEDSQIPTPNNTGKPNENAKLMSAFNYEEDKRYRNIAYSAEKSMELEGHEQILKYDNRHVSYWSDYFGQFNLDVAKFTNHPQPSYKYKKQALEQMRTKNIALVDKVIANITQVNLLRLGQNELVFNEAFLTEHASIFNKVCELTGMTRSQLEDKIKNSMMPKVIQTPSEHVAERRATLQKQKWQQPQASDNSTLVTQTDKVTS